MQEKGAGKDWMKKTSTLVGLVLTALTVYAILNLISVQEDLKDAMEQTAQLQAEIAAAQAENSDLEEKTQALESGEGVEELANRRLRLIRPDEVIFTDIE